jgi:radical SAM superfamily enzyme YgiQ (UPF0313 family)
VKVLLIVYDNDSHISFFPVGIAYIAAACRNAGHTVTIYNQDVYHYTENHLKNYLQKNEFDIIGLGACGGYYQYRKIGALMNAIKEIYPSPLPHTHNTIVNKRPFVIIGGHLVSADPSYFLRKYCCDAIIIGEGELTTVDLLDAVEKGRSLKKVSGIAFLNNGEYMQNERRPLIENVDDIPMPAYDLFPIDHYALLPFPSIKSNDRLMPMNSGRGCIFTCNFCYRMDKGFRPRSGQSILNEIRYLQSNYKITFFDFSDELLMSSVKRIKELCDVFIASGLNFRWACNGRLNFASIEALKLMQEAGCVFINYGIESVNDEALKNMNKQLTVKQITEGIENTLAVGISPGLNIIFGNIGETKECLKNDVDFLLKYDDHAQLRTIRPVTPYPGSPLYYYAIEKGLLKDCEDFYENKHTNSDLLTVNFTNMSDEEFYFSLYEANKILLDNYLLNIRKSNEKSLTSLYGNKDVSFRGFRHT